MVEKTIELTGSSATGIEEAIELAVSRAAVTIDALRRARVTEIRMEIADDRVARWTVDVQVSFEVKETVHD